MSSVCALDLPDGDPQIAVAPLEGARQAVREACGRQLPDAELSPRSRRLTAALASFVEPGDRVLVVCCDRHHSDLLVAYNAVHHLGAVVVVVPPDPARLRDLDAPGRHRVVLACEEGTAAVLAADAHGVVIGDAPGVLWWKALELRGDPRNVPVPHVWERGDIVDVVVDATGTIATRTFSEVHLQPADC